MSDGNTDDMTGIPQARLLPHIINHPSSIPPSLLFVTQVAPSQSPLLASHWVLFTIRPRVGPGSTSGGHSDGCTGQGFRVRYGRRPPRPSSVVCLSCSCTNGKRISGQNAEISRLFYRATGTASVRSRGSFSGTEMAMIPIHIPFSVSRNNCRVSCGCSPAMAGMRI